MKSFALCGKPVNVPVTASEPSLAMMVNWLLSAGENPSEASKVTPVRLTIPSTLSWS